MTRIRSLQLAIMGVVLAVAGPALAGPGAALVEVAFDGPWTAREQVQLHLGVSRALHAAGLQLVGPEQVEIALGGRSPSTCRDDRCRIDLGRALGVGRLVFANLRAESGGVTVSLVMFNVDVGERTGSANRFARGDSPAALHEAVVQAAGSLLRSEVPTAPARITVRSRPAGASIAIDGRPLGEGNAELPVAAGRHVVVLEKAGFERAEARIEVKGGDVATVDVTLMPLKQSAAPATLPVVPTGQGGRDEGEGRRPWRTAGFVAVGAGVVAMVTGIGLYTYGCSTEGNFKRCPVQASVRTTGTALLGVGGGLAAVGLGFWIYDAKRARARVSLLPGGASLAFDW